MAYIMKSQSIRRFVYTVLIIILTCLILSITIYQGQYFQNWFNSKYAPHKQFIIIGWFFLFLYYGICLFCLWQTNNKGRNYLFLFGIQFFAFAVYAISVYCFSAYILATVSSIFSVIFSIWLVIMLFKNKQYALMSLLAVTVLLYFYLVFRGIIYCSLEYGVWKE